MLRGFFAAYPSSLPEIGQSIEEAREKNDSQIQFRTWKSTFGAGKIIDQGVLPEIQTSDGLICDISVPNNNVFFELGYAIGLGKSVLPVKNSSIIDSGMYIRDLGIIDNIGYLEYENSSELVYKLNKTAIPAPIFSDIKSLNTRQPIYVLDALKRSELAAKIISAIKASARFFRSFDPHEEYRLSARAAWDDVTQSAGVLVSLLADNKEDYLLHNLRASFLAGLAVGLNKDCLILVDGSASRPLDFIDLCKTVKRPEEITDHVNAFAARAMSALAASHREVRDERKSLLSQISVGSTAAENEFRDLAEYFVNTPQFRSALNGEGRLIIGRKGSGKTAIFWRVRDTAREDGPDNLVVDLKPDGYQLRKFKEQIVKYLSAGTKDHTLTALWEYLVYSEIIYKIFEDDYRKFYGKDPVATELLDTLRNHYDAITVGREGDFSERMMGLLTDVAKRFRQTYGSEGNLFLKTEQVTQILYNADIRKIQKDTLEYLKKKNRVIILIDNIDKGWGAHGVDSDDVLIVSALMEALRKIERQATRRNIDFDWLLLLRSDVFELLVDAQSDRGKEDKIVVDWDSYASLRQIIEKRIDASTRIHEGPKQNEIQWGDIADPVIDGVGSLKWLIERSLMRPRYLIQRLLPLAPVARDVGSEAVVAEGMFV